MMTSDDAPAWYNNIESSAWAHGYNTAIEKTKFHLERMREEIKANNEWLPSILDGFKISHDGTESGQKAALVSVLIEWKEQIRKEWKNE
jgi:hypothetical protein